MTRRRNSEKIVFKCLLDRINAAATVTFYLKLKSTRFVSMKNFALFSLLFCSAHQHDTNETRSILISNAAAAESSCWPVGRNGIWENVCNFQLNDTMTSFAFQFSFMIDDNTIHSGSDKTCRNTRRAPISRSWAAVVLCCFSSISTNILNIFHYCTLDALAGSRFILSSQCRMYNRNSYVQRGGTQSQVQWLFGVSSECQGKK